MKDVIEDIKEVAIVGARFYVVMVSYENTKYVCIYVVVGKIDQQACTYEEQHESWILTDGTQKCDSFWVQKSC